MPLNPTKSLGFGYAAGPLSQLRLDAVAFDVALLLGFPGPLGALLSAGLETWLIPATYGLPFASHRHSHHG